MKIVIRMYAGLANRMFQYSYYLYLRKNGIEAYVDNNFKDYALKTQVIYWNRIFPNAPINQAPKHLIHMMCGGYSIVEKVLRHYLRFVSSAQFLNGACDYIKAEQLRKSKYLIGFFQNAEIVQEIEDKVKTVFSFSDFEDKKNLELAKKIQEENSVAIHVRKQKDYEIEVFKNTCKMDYYKRAMEFVKSKTENPHFYIFTDNANWVRQNFYGMDYTLIDHNPSIGYGNHFDMQLMALCKHNIIANSSYSWWGAFLNNNKDKLVIGPECWFNPDLLELRKLSNKIMCKGWIQL